MGHLDNVNETNSSGKRQSLTHELYTAVKVYQTKLLLFSNKSKKRNLHVFTLHLRSRAADKYRDILCKLHEEFCHTFQLSWKVENEIDLLTLFSLDVKKAPDNQNKSSLP
jgi:hypothetical protein